MRGELLPAALALRQGQHQIDDMDKTIKEIQKSMDKFIGLYEIVTNQYNPFVEPEDKKPAQPKIETAKMTEKPTEPAKIDTALGPEVPLTPEKPQEKK